MYSPQTPSLTRSPSTCVGKWEVGSFSHCRMSRRRAFANALRVLAVIMSSLCHLTKSMSISCAMNVDRDAIDAMHARIRPVVRRTPVVHANGADFGLGPFSLTFKLEQLQHAGSFKTRGAF